jgi:hypothetical protein
MQNPRTRRGISRTNAVEPPQTPYGFIGSAGHTRARELARNECAEKLKGKVERARGADIGLDPRYTYVRCKRSPYIRGRGIFPSLSLETKSR